MKRLFDIFISVIALLLFSLPLLLLMIVVRLKLGGPIFFRQLRPGLNGKPFEMIKFRTMTDERDVEGNLLPNHQRFTKFGNFLRASSLDELPELWNVLKGEMSIVGPRPLLMRYLELYSPYQSRRHEVRPGITGWAQVNGRNLLEWEEKFEFDVWYVDNYSMLVDVKIILATFQKVFRREGVNANSMTTMEPFLGSRRDGAKE